MIVFGIPELRVVKDQRRVVDRPGPLADDAGIHLVPRYGRLYPNDVKVGGAYEGAPLHCHRTGTAFIGAGRWP